MTVAARPSDVAAVALSTLAHVAGAAEPADDDGITGVTLSSDAVRPGDMYAALPGSRTHGARFAHQARDAGARAILTDPEGAELAVDAGLPLLIVESPRLVLGEVAATVYGRPAESLTLIGVTGTQGKTTTTQLLARGLASAGVRAGVIGTMGAAIDGEPVDSALTTPEAPDLHALFAVMRDRGVEVCAMEVSSHALVLGRVDGVRFDVAVFTNFGRDHLDFHPDVASYFAAKASLFGPDRCVRALLNADDPKVAELAGALEVPVHTYSASGADADWRADDVVLGGDGSRFVLHGPEGRKVPASVQLPGDFNVANAVSALAAAGEVGLDVAGLAAGISTLPSVRGRLERVDAGQPYLVFVDYAHKPDAVTAVLQTLRAVTGNRLLIVLGAGGDRDPGKRALMGAAAAELADVVVVTDDNPRSEDPAAIRAALVAGTAGARATVLEVGDRREAITTALTMARPGDTVLVAGKGHETGQRIAGEVLPFDDRSVVLDVLAGTGAASTGRGTGS